MTAPTALSDARAAQRRAAKHVRFCRVPFDLCRWCQWLEKQVAAAYWRADAELEASQR